MNPAGLCAHLLWPLSCPVCGCPAVAICPDCLDTLIVREGPRCVLCGADYPCREHPGLPPHYSAGPHEGITRDLVLDLKYRQRRVLGRLLGQALGRRFRPEGCCGIVPVPLHRGSSRSFNQALEISRGLGEELGLSVVDVLRWARKQPTQARGSAAQRRLMPEDAIVCRVRGPDAGRFVLVDDVRTTGTTLLRARSALERCHLEVGAFVTWSSA